MVTLFTSRAHATFVAVEISEVSVHR